MSRIEVYCTFCALLLIQRHAWLCLWFSSLFVFSYPIPQSQVTVGSGHWTELVRFCCISQISEIWGFLGESRVVLPSVTALILNLKVCPDLQRVVTKQIGVCVLLVFEEPLTRYVDFRPPCAVAYLCDLRLFTFIFWVSVFSPVKLDHEISEVPVVVN